MCLTLDNALYRGLESAPGPPASEASNGQILRNITHYIVRFFGPLGATLGAIFLLLASKVLCFHWFRPSIHLLAPLPHPPRLPASTSPPWVRRLAEGGIYIGPPHLRLSFFPLPHPSRHVSPYSPIFFRPNRANAQRACVAPGIVVRGARDDAWSGVNSGQRLFRVRNAHGADTGGYGYKGCSYPKNDWTFLKIRFSRLIPLIVFPVVTIREYRFPLLPSFSSDGKLPHHGGGGLG